MLTKLRSNQSGFTLVELMVAGAILSVLVLGFATYMYNQSKQQKALDLRRDSSAFKTEIINSITSESLMKSEEAEIGSI